MFEWLPQPQKTDKVLRCPYCVEGDTFRAMFGHTDGDWFTCAECGHLAFPSNPVYRCTCRKCTAFTLTIEDPNFKSSSPALARILKPFRREDKATDSTEI